MKKRFLALYLPESKIEAIKSAAYYCLSLTPHVGVENGIKLRDLDSPLKSGLLLDISGTERLHESEKELAFKIKNKLSTLGIPHRIAIASTIGAAWAFSRFKGEDVYIFHGSHTEFKESLAELPLEALRITPDQSDAIKELGIDTIGELFKIPLKNIGYRFGIPVYDRLNQLLGYVSEGIKLFRYFDKISAARRFDSPLHSKHAVSFWTNILLEKVFKKLHSKSLWPSSYLLSFVLTDRSIITRNISLQLASDNLKHVSSVIEANIERVEFGKELTEIRILALDLRPPAKVQNDIFNKTGRNIELDKRMAEYLNLLSQKLGPQNITKVLFRESYIPEKSYSFKGLNQKQSKAEKDFFIPELPPILHPPEPLKAIALLPDSSPSFINYKGQHLKIIKGQGPFRISLEWWEQPIDKQHLYRDYFRVQEENGSWLWVFRESESMQWFKQGLWA